MQMPKSCTACFDAGIVTAMVNLGKTCPFCESVIRFGGLTRARHPECPLFSVPEPHGSLGDLEALQNQIDIARNYGMIGKTTHYKLQKLIKEAPTIIPAEEKENG